METLEKEIARREKEDNPFTFKEKLTNYLGLYGTPFRISSVTFGYMIFLVMTFFVARTIRYLTLLRDNKTLRITTFSLSGIPTRYRHYDVPLEHVSFENINKNNVKKFRVRVKGTLLPFMLDSRETFHNQVLFANKIGQKRFF